MSFDITLCIEHILLRLVRQARAMRSKTRAKAAGIKIEPVAIVRDVQNAPVYVKVRTFTLCILQPP